ncbi:MAG: protein-glutamate O-methyltransferase [Bacteroidota bacterium]|nr:protein-glutamate O-methyltransferase [Bacteroidota bacterium]
MSDQKIESQNLAGIYKIQMTDADFNRLSIFINRELGIKMPKEKKIMLQSRLQKRLNEFSFNTFREYIDYVFSNAGKQTELLKMIDLVTTNKTDFFREPVHFEFLYEKVIPEILNNINSRQPVKIWSAGCSSGEEPYTIAIVLSEFIENVQYFDYSIFGTDLSFRILDKALNAIYTDDRIANIPMSIKKKYFLKSKDNQNKTVRVIPELRSKLSLQRLNFMDYSYDVPGDYDIIFCRNVLIYFDRDTQEKVINRLCYKLKNNGYFFLGHSESITGLNVPLKQVKPTIFKKISYE